MAGLPKSYFKRFPGNLKRAWAAYRSEHGGAKKKRRSVRASGKPARKHGGEKMAKKKKRTGTRRRSVRHTARRARRRVGVAMASRPAQILVGAVVATGGAVGTSYAINNIPKVKDWTPGSKASAQIALGLLAIFCPKLPLLPQKFVRPAGAGAVVAGVMGLVKNFTGINPMAGPSSGGMTLSPSQMRQVISQGGMNAPVRSLRMNAPAPVRMHGSFNGGNPSKGFGGLDM